jgi:hypothetical protein
MAAALVRWNLSDFNRRRSVAYLLPDDMGRVLYAGRLGDAAEEADPAKIRPDDEEDDLAAEGPAL